MLSLLGQIQHDTGLIVLCLFALFVISGVVFLLYDAFSPSFLQLTPLLITVCVWIFVFTTGMSLFTFAGVAVSLGSTVNVRYNRKPTLLNYTSLIGR